MTFERYLANETKIVTIMHDLLGSRENRINPLYPINQCIEIIKLLMSDNSPLGYAQKIKIIDVAVARPHYKRYQHELQALRATLRKSLPPQHIPTLKKLCCDSIGTQSRGQQLRMLTNRRVPLNVRAKIARELFPDSVLTSIILFKENWRDPAVFFHKKLLCAQPRRAAIATRNAAVTTAHITGQVIKYTCFFIGACEIILLIIYLAIDAIFPTGDKQLPSLG